MKAKTYFVPGISGSECEAMQVPSLEDADRSAAFAGWLQIARAWWDYTDPDDGSIQIRTPPEDQRGAISVARPDMWVLKRRRDGLFVVLTDGVFKELYCEVKAAA